MEGVTTARSVALDCLLAAEKRGSWPDGYLRNAIRQADLDRRDAALCTQLAYGVLQNSRLLDWHGDRFSNTPMEKLEPAVRSVLRLGLYQLLFLDRVPVHAAVNESVALCKASTRTSRAAGLVNAVLRAFDREENHPVPNDLGVRYSHPDWLVKEFSNTLPIGELEALLAADNDPVPTQAQVNTLKTAPAQLLAELTAAGVTARAHPWLEGCLELEDTGSLEGLTAFREGRFYIQDAAARLAVTAAAPQPGMAVLDACAAPGGKSFAAAIDMGNEGAILSCDIHPHKQKLIAEGAARLGISILETAVKNGKKFDPALEGKFDLVMADVPCSGLGILRKKPDIRCKDPAELSRLPEIQGDILANVARYVRPGGALLYATCTLLKRENEDVVTAFLAENRSFTLEHFTLPGPVGETPGMVTLWPHRHGTDGFFMAKLRKRL